MPWGSNDFGQLDVPEPNSGFVSVTCGADFSLGLKDDGSIVAWGNYGPICNEPEPNAGYVAVTANNWNAYALKTQPVFGDITQNGTVDVDDLLEVINHWGACAPALSGRSDRQWHGGCG